MSLTGMQAGVWMDGLIGEMNTEREGGSGRQKVGGHLGAFSLHCSVQASQFKRPA